MSKGAVFVMNHVPLEDFNLLKGRKYNLSSFDFLFIYLFTFEMFHCVIFENVKEYCSHWFLSLSFQEVRVHIF